MKIYKLYQVVICVVAMAICPVYSLASDMQPDEENVKTRTSVHLLDGMKFKGPTGEKGKKDHHTDILSFQEGLFTSSECYQFGFKGGTYTATVQGGVIRFQAETISPTHGKMEWAGTLKGETLEVDYSWTRERWLWTTYRQYWFKGELVK